VDRQVAVGVNDRHRAILRWLLRFGLRPEHRVLEIGCGIGTVTELVVEQLRPGGSLVGIDLSAESIAIARARLGSDANVELIAGDILEVEVPLRFDVVVLPDVIEHVPLDLHPALFGRVASWLTSDGFALLHYPNPHHLAWCRVHRPEDVQIIDQPIHAHQLTANAHAHGLYLDYLQTYSIWVRDGDYVVAVLRPTPASWDPTELPERPPSLPARIAARVRVLRR
jgi:cyclopropane fatty-acyl-phospholipid synthase-like methyltransferase